MTIMKNRLLHIASGAIAAAALMLTATGCIFEEPELTAEGEPGVDPTETVVTTDISLSLVLPSLEKGGEPFAVPPCAGTAYRRRTVVSAYADGFPAVSKTVYSDIEQEGGSLDLSVALRLHARAYNLAVWSDYVREQDGTTDGGYFYNIGRLPNIYMSTTYRGADNYKDAACGYAAIDLSEFAGELGSHKKVEMALGRPVGRISYVATDAGAFLDRIASGAVKGGSFTVRVSYPGYLCMGYNVETSLLRHSLMYMKFEKAFKSADLEAGKPFTLAFDYLFATADKAMEVPVRIDILDSAKENVIATAAFNAFVRAGRTSTVSYSFLTSEAGEGVEIDPEFSGSETIVIPARPTE